MYDPKKYSSEAQHAFFDSHEERTVSEPPPTDHGPCKVQQLVLLGVHAHNRFTTQADGDASIAAVREVEFDNFLACSLSRFLSALSLYIVRH